MLLKKRNYLFFFHTIFTKPQISSIKINFLIFLITDEEEEENTDSPDAPGDDQEVTYTVGVEVQFYNSKMAR